MNLRTAAVAGLLVLLVSGCGSANVGQQASEPSGSAGVASDASETVRRDEATWTPERTQRLRVGLERVGNGGLATWVVLGDSKTAGNGDVLSSETWPSLLTDRLGVRSAGTFGITSNAIRWLDHRWGFNPGYDTTTWADWNGNLAASADAGVKQIAFYSDTPGTEVEIVFRSDFGGFTYTIDGGEPASMPYQAGTSWRTIVVGGLADTVHQVTIAPGTGYTLVHGVGVREKSGLLVMNEAVPGWTTNEYTEETTSSSLEKAGAAWALTDQADVVFISIGVNDFFGDTVWDAGWTLEGYTANLRAMVERAQAGTVRSDVVIVIETNVSTPGMNDDVWEQYVEAQYAVAEEYGLPVLDLSDRGGGVLELMDAGLVGDDYVHETEAGQRWIADALAARIESVLG